MTASALTWEELIFTARYEGKLPVVIPTASAPLIGYFEPNREIEATFVMALLDREPKVRYLAIAAAIWSSRINQGLDG